MAVAATSTFLSQQNTSFVATKYACGDKSFVGTKLCLSPQNIFVATKPLSRQISVATNINLSRQNRSFVGLVATKLLSRQKTCFCRDKHVFVATKMILVAAPASDSHTDSRSQVFARRTHGGQRVASGHRLPQRRVPGLLRCVVVTAWVSHNSVPHHTL